MSVGSIVSQLKRMPRIDRGVKTVMDALYPIHCPLCRQPNPLGICSVCLQGLDRIEFPCPRCGANFRGPGQCGTCQAIAPDYDATLAPFRYGSPLSGLIHQVKYRRKIAFVRPLAALLTHEIIRTASPRPQLLIPVPLHLSKLLWRGFNQSVEIARYLSAELEIPFDRTLIQRSRRTQAQVSLPFRHRKQNVSGCFGLCRPLDVKSVAIVDDVVTSGETVNQLAGVLKRAGATLIQVWAPLRTDL